MKVYQDRKFYTEYFFLYSPILFANEDGSKVKDRVIRNREHVDSRLIVICLAFEFRNQHTWSVYVIRNKLSSLSTLQSETVDVFLSLYLQVLLQINCNSLLCVPRTLPGNKSLIQKPLILIKWNTCRPIVMYWRDNCFPQTRSWRHLDPVSVSWQS